MSRLRIVDPQKVDGKVKPLLDAVQKKMGATPNIMRAMANSPAALGAYLGFSGALADSGLGLKLRERLALAVAEANGCEYCVAAHTVLGKQAGLSDDDILASRKGVSDDPKSNAAMAFARALLGSRGHVTDGDVHGLRDAGFGDGEIAELVALVVLNLFTNYINDVAQTPLDFPQAPALD